MTRSRIRKNSEAQEKRRGRNKRMKLFGFMMILCMTGLLARLGYITVVHGAEFERIAVRQLIIRQSNVEQVIEPVRGGILDRNRQPLVDNEIVYLVALDVNVLLSLPDNRRNRELIEETINTLNEVLHIPVSTLEGYLNPYSETFRATYWRIIAQEVPAYTALSLQGLRHVHLRPSALQRFPDPYLAPQVLGFIRGDARWGLELEYRAELLGDPGRILRAFQADSAPIEEIPARDGHWLVTTLDSGIQRIAQRVVDEAAVLYQARFTGVAVMNPHTGEVLAMAQWPSFPLDAPDDGTRFTDPGASSFWHYMEPEEQMSHMFRTWPNFFLSQTFEPGSTFKPFVMAAAVEEGVINPHVERFYCEGVRQVADWDIHCHNVHGHGSLTMLEALVVSCNLAMIDIVQAMGRDVFYNFRNDFGFGEQTGIDLPGEESVSSPLVMYTRAQLNPVELATSSFGQGFNTTSIQALNAFAALVNGGYVMRPYVVSQIVDAQGQVQRETMPTVVRNILSHNTSDFMRESMQAVVSAPNGTGRRAAIEGFTIGGKTGTGEQIPRGTKVVTSFVGYMPVENPQFIAIAVVYDPYDIGLTAGASAAVMLREVFEGIIDYRQLPPAGAEQATGVLNIGGEVLQDFSGMQLSEVTPILNRMGVDFEITGRGSTIAYHIPGANQPVPRRTPLFLHMDGDISDLDGLTFMPSVEGLPVERAVEMVETSGLVPFIVSTGPMGRGDSDSEEEAEDVWIVDRQFPRAGLHIQRGTEVRLRTRVVE